jgi:hypothetical protein
MSTGKDREMKCEKCGFNGKTTDKYCNECGAKIPDGRTTNEQHEGTPIDRYILVSVAIIMAIVIAGPTKTVYVPIEVPYEDVEYYTDSEPYDAQEQFEVPVPYEAMETYTDIVPTLVSVPYIDYEDKTYYAPPGTHYSNLTDGCRCTNYVWGDCVEATCSYPVTKYRTETQDKQVEKTRPVTKYNTETQYRKVTRYRDIQKSRTIIKMRTEQRPHEVNWLLNFDVPWRFHLSRRSNAAE